MNLVRLLFLETSLSFLQFQFLIQMLTASAQVFRIGHILCLETPNHQSKEEPVVYITIRPSRIVRTPTDPCNPW